MILKTVSLACEKKINYGRKSGDYVFCTVEGNYSNYAHLNPLACFMKEEGLH
jgi:hypothetical protein